MLEVAFFILPGLFSYYAISLTDNHKNTSSTNQWILILVLGLYSILGYLFLTAILEFIISPIMNVSENLRDFNLEAKLTKKNKLNFNTLFFLLHSTCSFLCGYFCPRMWALVAHTTTLDNFLNTSHQSDPFMICLDDGKIYVGSIITVDLIAGTPIEQRFISITPYLSCKRDNEGKIKVITAYIEQDGEKIKINKAAQESNLILPLKTIKSIRNFNLNYFLDYIITKNITIDSSQVEFIKIFENYEKSKNPSYAESELHETTSTSNEYQEKVLWILIKQKLKSLFN